HRRSMQSCPGATHRFGKSWDERVRMRASGTFRPTTSGTVIVGLERSLLEQGAQFPISIKTTFPEPRISAPTNSNVSRISIGNRSPSRLGVSTRTTSLGFHVLRLRYDADPTKTRQQSKAVAGSNRLRPVSANCRSCPPTPARQQIGSGASLQAEGD